MQKLSLKSFIYFLTERLCFPRPNVKEIYQKYQIEKILCYHILTDTDSTSLQFLVISDPNSDFPESKIGAEIFEIVVNTDIYKRFDTSHSFSDNVNARKEKRKKNLAYTKY